MQHITNRLIKVLLLGVILTTSGVYAQNPTVVRGQGGLTNSNGKTTGIVNLDFNPAVINSTERSFIGSWVADILSITNLALRGDANGGGFSFTNLNAVVATTSVDTPAINMSDETTIWEDDTAATGGALAFFTEKSNIALISTNTCFYDAGLTAPFATFNSVNKRLSVGSNTSPLATIHVVGASAADTNSPLFLVQGSTTRNSNIAEFIGAAGNADRTNLVMHKTGNISIPVIGTKVGVVGNVDSPVGGVVCLTSWLDGTKTNWGFWQYDGANWVTNTAFTSTLP